MRPLVILGLLAVLASPGVAQEVQPPTIYANGREAYRIDADAVEFQIVIEGHGNTAMQALAPCTSGLDSVRAALTRLSIPSLTIDVIPLGVAPATNQYGQPTTGERYIAKTAIRVRLSDLRLLPRITATAIDAGATRTAHFRWSTTRLDGVQRVAREAAVAQARREAETVARALGGSLGALRSVSMNDDRDPADYYQNQDQSVQSTPEVRGSLVVNASWDFVPPRP